MNLDDRLESMIGDDEIGVPGLGVIVYKDGREIYSKFLGRCRIDPDKIVTRDTRFRVASISKMFTIFSIMKLVESGKISLDENVEEYLNSRLRNPNDPNRKFTIRMLASHISSLRDGKIYSIPPEFSVREFFEPNGKFFEDGIHFASNFDFEYCNLNYGILGTIIESVTHERFDLYQKKFLKQLDIAAEYLPGNLSPDEFENLGTIYRKDQFGNWIGKIDDYHGIQPARDSVQLQNPYAEDFQGIYSLKNYQIGTNATIFSPQGGLRISFDELSHALEMLINEGIYRGRRILTAESVNQMFKSNWIYDPQIQNGNPYGVIQNYGLGTYFVDGKSDARVCRNHEIDLIGHTGSAFGLLSGMFLIPNTRDGFIYMMNGEAIEEDVDPRSLGEFSLNYIWEEKIMDSICEFLIQK